MSSADIPVTGRYRRLGLTAVVLAAVLVLGASLSLDAFHRYLLVSASLLVAANYIWVGRRGSQSARRTALAIYLAASVGFVLFDVPQIDGVTVRLADTPQILAATLEQYRRGNAVPVHDTRLVDSARRPATVSFGLRIPRAELDRLALVLGKTQRSYRLTRLTYDSRLLGWPLPLVVARGRGLARYLGIDISRMTPTFDQHGLNLESRRKDAPTISIDAKLDQVQAEAVPGRLRRVRIARLAVCMVFGFGVFFAPALVAPWHRVEPRLKRFLLD